MKRAYTIPSWAVARLARDKEIVHLNGQVSWWQKFRAFVARLKGCG